MDHLGQHLLGGVLANVTVHNQQAIYVIGILVSMLVFLDNIILLAQYAQAIQGILVVLQFANEMATITSLLL